MTSLNFQFNIFKKIYIICSILTISSQISFAQWIQTSGPPGGYSTGLKAIGDTLYVANSVHHSSSIYANNGSFYSSIDHGLTWQPDTIGLQGIVRDVCKIGDTLFAATFNDGLFRKIGTAWSFIGFYNFQSMTLFEHNGDLYVASSGELNKSTDRGNSFFQIGNGLGSQFEIVEFHAIGDTIFVASNYGVHRCSDGIYWENKYIGRVLDFTINENSIFIVTLNDTILTSTDKGDTWNPIGSGITDRAFDILSIGDTLMSLVIDTTLNHYHVFKSFDNGISWTSAASGLPDFANINRLSNIGNEIFVSTGLYGESVYKTIDFGNNWVEANIGLSNLQIGVLYNYSGALFCGSATYNGIHKSFDGGANWIRSGNGIHSDTSITSNIGAGFFTSDSQYLYASIYYNGGSKLIMSNDTGNTWMPMNLNFSGYILGPLLVKDSVLFVAVCNKIFYTSNRGSTWDSTVVSGCISSFTTLANDLYAGVYQHGVLKSTDNGITWFDSNSGFTPFLSVRKLITNGNDLIAGTDSGIYISTNNGLNWASQNIGISPYLKVSSLTARSDTIIFGVESQFDPDYGQLYISLDNGNNWSDFNRPGYPSKINDLTIINDTLFAATSGYSVWKRSLRDTTILNGGNQPSTPSKKLSIFPNPASNYLNVILDKNSSGKIKITDLNGKIFFNDNIFDNVMELNTSGLSSGIYLIQYISDKESFTEKLIIFNSP